MVLSDPIYHESKEHTQTFVRLRICKATQPIELLKLRRSRPTENVPALEQVKTPDEFGRKVEFFFFL